MNKINSSESNITVIYIVNLLISNLKIIFFGMLFFSLLGYVFFKVANQESYIAKSIIHVGYFSDDIPLSNVETIESYESLENYLQIEYIQLPKYNNSPILLGALEKQTMPNGSYLMLLSSNKNPSIDEAKSNLKSVIKSIIERHNQLKKNKTSIIQNNIIETEAELSSIKKKIESINKQLAEQENIGVSSNEAINDETSETFKKFLMFELGIENMNKIANGAVTFFFPEISLMELKDEERDLIESIAEDKKKLSTSNFVMTKIYDESEEVQNISSHNLQLNLIAFTFLGFLISITTILLRDFYLIYIDKK